MSASASAQVNSSGQVNASAPGGLHELQQRFADLRFGMFIHFNIPAFMDQDWADPDASPAIFDPKKLDCSQWAKAAKAANMSYGCLTTKHHSGFCIWDTKTTDYNVMNSPLKRDVVRDEEIYTLVKTLQPGCLLMDLNSAKYPPEALMYTDIKSYEQGAGQHISKETNRLPALACLPLNAAWFWKKSFPGTSVKDPKMLIDDNFHTSWISNSTVKDPWYEVEFDKDKAFNTIVLTEDKPHIKRYRLEYFQNGSWKLLLSGSDTGRVKIHRFNRISGSKVRVRIDQFDTPPGIAEFGVYDERR